MRRILPSSVPGSGRCPAGRRRSRRRRGRCRGSRPGRRRAGRRCGWRRAGRRHEQRPAARRRPRHRARGPELGDDGGRRRRLRVVDEEPAVRGVTRGGRRGRAAPARRWPRSGPRCRGTAWPGFSVTYDADAASLLDDVEPLAVAGHRLQVQRKVEPGDDPPRDERRHARGRGERTGRGGQGCRSRRGQGAAVASPAPGQEEDEERCERGRGGGRAHARTRGHWDSSLPRHSTV